MSTDDPSNRIPPALPTNGLELAHVATPALEVQPETSIETAQRLLYQHDHFHAAVLANGKVIGVIVRRDVDSRMGGVSGFGYALFARKPVTEIMRSNFLRIDTSTSLPEVLSRMNERSGRSFHDDVLLTTPTLEPIGFLSMRTLVQLQHRMLQEKIASLDAAGCELNEANHRLSEARDEALEGARAKAAFLANMSHEIRTPMNGVIGMTSLLMQTPLQPEQRDYVKTIQSSGETLLTVLNDILDFSKIESGRLDLEIQPVDLEQSITSTLHLFAASASAKHLELVYQIAPEAPVHLPSDPTRLKQVLGNLVGNAVKFTERGHVAVRASRAGTDASPYLRIEIQDTGIGIPPEKHSRLFQAFSQADISTARRYGGTGLGLVISARLVNLLGGSLEFESQPDRGSKFWFEIPVPAELPTHHHGPDLGLLGRTALVADQHSVSREVLRDLLEECGITCHTVGSARELASLGPARHGFDFAFLEIELLGPAPVAAIHRLQTDGGLPVRTALLAQFGRPVPEALRSLPGVNGWLNKPLSRATIREWLRGKPQERSLVTPIDETASTLRFQRTLKLLVAEDNPVNRIVISKQLNRLGLECDLVVDGRQAIAAAERQCYDGILMDVQMPELDGLEATQMIRRRLPDDRQPYIIALTANAMSADRQRCLNAGMDNYLAKPVRIEALAAALRQIPAALLSDGVVVAFPAPGAAPGNG